MSGRTLARIGLGSLIFIQLPLYSVAMRRKAADVAREFIPPHKKLTTLVKLVFCYRSFRPRVRARDSRTIGSHCICNETITALRPINDLR